MSNATPSRLGQANQAGDVDALFLEVFSGLVLSKYDKRQVTDDRQMVRNIKSGKSAQFPITWESEAEYHVPGAEILGNPISHNEKNIAIEQLLIAHVFISNLDEAMNHYEVRAEYAHQLGQALANAKDKNTFRAIFQGAAASHPIDTSGDNDGTPIQQASLSTDPDVLKAAIYDAAQTLDEKNVPDSDRFAVLRPLAWYLLLEDGEFIHRDYAGEGSKARAMMPFASDLQVLKSNNVPTADDSANPAVPTVLQGDFRELVGLVWHKNAIGTVKLLDLKTDVGYDMRRQGTLFVSKFAIGQDFLRTEGCISLEDTSIVP